MPDDNYSLGEEVSATSSSTRVMCSVCGKKLSRYNKTGRCFHHFDPEKERRYLERRGQRTGSTNTPSLLPSVPETVEESLKEVISSPAQIIQAVSELFAVSRVDLERSGRQVSIVRARHVVMYLLYTDTSLSYPAIGKLLGDRDHTTVTHGVSKITKELQTEADLQRVIRYLRSKYQRPPIS